MRRDLRVMPMNAPPAVSGGPAVSVDRDSMRIVIDVGSRREGSSKEG